MAFSTGTMVVCLKHVGITDLEGERLKMSVKTLASWSVHARSTHPGNPSGPAALWMLTFLKVLLTSAAESVITQSTRTASALMHVSVLFPRSEHRSSLALCQACSVIPKKTQGCNRCQRCLNKVLSKGSEYLCICDISVFYYTFSNTSKNLSLLCHYWLTRRKKLFNQF